MFCATKGLVWVGLSVLTTLLAACAVAPAERGLDKSGVGMVLLPLRHAGIRDARAEFRRTFCAVLSESSSASSAHAQDCDTWIRRLGDEPAPRHEYPDPKAMMLPALGPVRWDVAVLPGAFGDCVASVVDVFADAVPHLRSLGLHVERVPLRGRASVRENASVLREYAIAHAQRRPQQKLLLLAYSKGTADALHALHVHVELRERVAVLVSVAGLVNGSYVADALPRLAQGLIAHLALPNCSPGENDFISSTDRIARAESLSAMPALPDVRMYSLVAWPEPQRISTLLRDQWAQLAQWNPRNDGQLLDYDAIVPGSTLLGYLNADHLSVALPLEAYSPTLASAVQHRYFPRPVLLEAVLRLLLSEHAHSN
jgi:hypothetical protein